MNIFDDFDRYGEQPDHINEEGTKWWLDKSMLKYAKRRKVAGYIPYIVETKDGEKTRVLVDKDKQRVVYETPGMEAMACFIDVIPIMLKD